METVPQQAGKHQHQQSVPSENTSDYYKHNPILDHLNTEVDTCFDTGCLQNLIESIQLLPFEVVKTTSQLKNFTTQWRSLAIQAIINPRRAYARVTVLVLCVCQSDFLLLVFSNTVR